MGFGVGGSGKGVMEEGRRENVCEEKMERWFSK